MNEYGWRIWLEGNAWECIEPLEDEMDAYEEAEEKCLDLIEEWADDDYCLEDFEIEVFEVL